MLKGFLSLILIFGAGILLMSLGMPKEFAIVQDYTRDGYERVVATFTKDNNILAEEENVLPATPEPLIKTDTGPVRNTSIDLDIDAIIDETNIERIKAGLIPLKKNSRLDLSALLKTEDMVTFQYFEHESPSGDSVSDLGQKAGYDYITMGENLALGNFEDADELVAAWMASPGHRANILNKKYQEIGVYAAQGDYRGQKVWFAVQHFGTQKSVCPSISSTLKSEIDKINKGLNTREAQIQTAKADLEEPQAQFDADYRQRVEDFNNLVAVYNSSVALSKQKTDQYNAQVIAFNACLTQFQ